MRIYTRFWIKWGDGISVKIFDVAKKAGVSTATVSRVLNGEKYVKEEVREKVTRAAKEMNYVPNHLARSLVVKKTNLIGVIVSDISSSFFSTILNSIESCASKRDYSIIVCNINEDVEKELKYLEVFGQFRVDGLLLMHEKINRQIKERLMSMEIPIVLGSVKIMALKLPSVNIDDFRAAYDAVNYLIELGHKRIGYFGSALEDTSGGLLRHSGVVKAFQDNGLKLEDSLTRFVPLKLEDGYRAMEGLFDSNIALPTAIFAGSDDLAAGVINCILDKGMSVPEDISVIGFDDSKLAGAIRPGLTTVHQPIEKIGQTSVKMLIKMIENEKIEANEVIFPHEIKIRESCRRLTEEETVL